MVGQSPHFSNILSEPQDLRAGGHHSNWEETPNLKYCLNMDLNTQSRYIIYIPAAVKQDLSLPSRHPSVCGGDSGAVPQPCHNGPDDRFHRRFNTHLAGVNGQVVVDGIGDIGIKGMPDECFAL